MAKTRLIGTVVSDKMQKTVVVQVERLKKHPKYLRRFRVHKKFKAHDEKGEYHAGDRVVIEQCKPLSKDKEWVVIEKIGTSALPEEQETGEVNPGIIV